MIIYLDGLTIEGSVLALNSLRIKLETDSMAYNELYKKYNSEVFKEVSIKKHNKAQHIAEALGRIEE